VSKIQFRRAVAMYSLVGIVALAAALSAMFRWHFYSFARRDDPPAVTAAQLRVLVARMGLHPELVATAGLNADQATAMINRLRSHYADLDPDLESATSALNTATAQAESLRRKIVAGKGNAGDVAALATARSQATTAAQSLATARANVMSDLSEVVGGDAVQVIATIQGNQKWTALPVYFRVITRTPADWVTLRDAVASRDTSTRLGETPADGALSIISDAESNQTVAAAKTGFQSNAASVSAAIAAAINQQ
jgi:hypothetical protein